MVQHSPTDAELMKALSLYSESLELKASASKSSKDLSALDHWYRVELRETTNKRKLENKTGSHNTYLTKDELVKLMTWKLARGKWRPRLMDLISSNPAALIKSVTSSASSSKMPHQQSITLLSTLKGVGPATASAILSLFVESTPENGFGYGFLSDEAFQCIFGPNVKVEYTPKALERFQEGLKVRVQQSQESKDNGWQGVEKLEMAAWSWAIQNRYGGTLAKPNDVADEKVNAVGTKEKVKNDKDGQGRKRKLPDSDSSKARKKTT